MREFQLGRYLKKWLPLLIGFFVVMSILSYRVIQKRQTYIASTVIEYCNDGASQGYAPDGTRINTAEINSSANMARVMRALGMSVEDYSLDRMCSSINVVPIQDEQISTIREAVNKEGEEYTEQPTSFIVSCTLDYTGSKWQAQMILNQLMDVYYADYSGKHINASAFSNQTAGILDSDYDYLEMIEMIDQQLGDTVDILQVNFNRDQSFRAARTGYSYAELYDQFLLLRQIDIPQLYSFILGNQITRDRELLIDKYNNRIEQYTLDGTFSREQIEDVLRVVDAYVEKMRASGNTDIDFNYILQDVYDNYRYDEEGQRWGNTSERTVQYDRLLRHWLSEQNDADYAVIQSAYCQYIINAFTNGAASLEYSTPEGADPVDELIPVQEQKGSSGLLRGTASAVQASQDSVDDYMEAVSGNPMVTGEADEGAVRAMIAVLLDKMQSLYDVTVQTNEEYNEYLGAQNIRILSTTETHDGMNVKLYMALISFFFLVVGCCGVVLLGRAEDIVEYIFYRDHETGAMNRVACDNYIRDLSDIVLPVQRSCASVRLTNHRELNEMLGRKGTDQVIADIAAALKKCYGGQKDSFIGYNGGGHFIVFFNLVGGDRASECDRLAAALHQMIDTEDAEYQIGIANAGEDDRYSIRGLLSRAIEVQKKYTNRR